MITWNDIRDKSVRDEFIHDDKYTLVGSNGKADTLVIDLEFAKTLSGDVQAILIELIKPVKMTQREVISFNFDDIIDMNSKGFTTREICKKYKISQTTLYRYIGDNCIDWQRNHEKMKGL